MAIEDKKYDSIHGKTGSNKDTMKAKFDELFNQELNMWWWRLTILFFILSLFSFILLRYALKRITQYENLINQTNPQK